VDIRTLFEAIRAAVEAYGAGKINEGEKGGEIQPAPKTNLTQIRYAPSFSLPNLSSLAANEHPYTMQTLASFLGFVQPSKQPTTMFDAAFGALELIKEGYLTEARVTSLEVFKIAETVSVAKQARARAIEEAKRQAAEAEARRKEVERKAAELKRQQEEAETRRKAAACQDRAMPSQILVLVCAVNGYMQIVKQACTKCIRFQV